MKSAKEVRWPELQSVHTIIFDFDGVFTDNKVYVADDGSERVRCDRADGLAIDFIRYYQRAGRLSAGMFILSKERNAVVAARARKLGLDCQHAIGDKLGFVKQYLSKHEVERPSPPAGVIFLGNDLNDLPLMGFVGFSVAPIDAHPRVLESASVVLPQKGGEGFVRAFVERFLSLDALTAGELDELVSNC